MFLMFKCQLSIPTIVEVSCLDCLVRPLLFVDLCCQKAIEGTELQSLCTQGTLKGGRLRHSWTTIFGLLSFLLFLWSRYVYSVFRHVRRLSPFFSLSFNWNRAHVTFGCYLITIKLSILFLEQSCVFIPINPSLLFKCA